MKYSLKYTGPKPLYTATGVTFHASKADKYIYLGTLAELIRALDHEYQDNQNYITQTEQRLYDEKSILALIRTYIPNLNEKIEEWIEKTTQKIDSDIMRAQNNLILNDETREILINNIEWIRPYQIQRTINKSIYYAGVEALAIIVKQRHIKYISTPIDSKLLHILHSLRGPLRQLHPPFDSKIEIYKKQEHLVVELKILN